MRLTLRIALLGMLVAACTRQPEVLKFNDSLAKQQHQIETSIDSLAICLARRDVVAVEQAYYQTKKQIEQAQAWIQKSQTGSDSVLSVAFVGYCAQYQQSLAKFVPMVKKNYSLPDSLYTIAVHSSFELAIRNFNQARVDNIYKLSLAQENFARRHKLVISGVAKQSVRTADSDSID